MEEHHEKKENITISKVALWQIIAGVFAFLFVISLFTGGFGFGATGQAATSTTDTTNNEQSVPTGVKTVSAADFVDDDPALGDKDAPLTIIEFSDFQCPYCRLFWTETFPTLKQQYIDTGKVKFVYRDFPLSFHEMALPSAEAANCVREQGGDEAYFKIHDKIFSEQNILDGGTVRSTVSYTENDLKKWVKDIGYNIDNCLDSRKYQNEVLADLQGSQEAGGEGTPYFIVGNQPLSGAQPYSAFKAVIDAQL